MHGVIVLVEPETRVLWAIKENLMKQFQREFKIYSADSDSVALEKLKQLQKYNNSLALFVVKQHNSPITGAEFLQLIMETFPTAKSLLLNLYDCDDIPARIPLLQAVKI